LPLFDGLRALAALSVLTFHVSARLGAYKTTDWGSALLRANIGVTVFFVISGFLLYRPFVDSRFGGPPPRPLLNFFRARALRIVPAYWLALLVLGFGSLAQYVHGHDFWRYVFFLQIYDYRTAFLGLTVAWTLCTEVTFYLVLPLLAAGVLRATVGAATSRRRLGIELSIIAGLAAASLFAKAVFPATFGAGSVGSLTLLGLFHWFALGMMLAVLSVAADRGVVVAGLGYGLRYRDAAWLLAVAFLLLAQWTVPHQDGNVADYGVIAQFAYGMFAVCLVWPAIWTSQSRGVAWHVLGNPVVAWLGIVSYGIYLWHVTVIERFVPRIADVNTSLGPKFLLLAIATVFGTVAVAAASYYAVERPLLRFKGRRSSSAR
jgi:peptidoglycan/LPS O-acetylase OafA/YrhL